MELKATGNVCDTCDSPLISNRQLAKITDAQRTEVKARGWRRAHLSARCHACAKRLRSGPMPGRVVPRAVVLNEWRWLHEAGELNRGESRAHRIRLAAPRIGMTTTALEKALERAQVAA